MLTRTLAVIAGATMLTASAATFANAEPYGRVEVRSPVDARSPVDSGSGHHNDDDYGYGGGNYRPRPPVGWGGPAYRPGFGPGFGLPRVEARVSYGYDWRDPQVREAMARTQAIEAWRTKVSYRFGDRFAHWRVAQDKYVDCTRTRATLTCVASARPQSGWAGWRRWGWNTGY